MLPYAIILLGVAVGALAWRLSAALVALGERIVGALRALTDRESEPSALVAEDRERIGDLTVRLKTLEKSLEAHEDSTTARFNRIAANKRRDAEATAPTVALDEDPMQEALPFGAANRAPVRFGSRTPMPRGFGAANRG